METPVEEELAPPAPHVLIYDRIASNHRRSALLMAAFFAFVALPQAVIAIILVAVLPRPAAEVVAAVAATLGLAEFVLLGSFAYFASDRVALKLVAARPVERAQEPELYRLLENLCIGSGLPLPHAFVIEDASLNAMATGRDPRHAAIAVTRGMLTGLDATELEGVLAHELSHVGNHDTRLMTLIVFLVSLLSYVPDHLFVYEARDYSRTEATFRGDNPLLGALVYMTVGPFALLVGMLARLIGFAASREREFLADAGAVLLTRNPDGLLHALRKARDGDGVVPALIGPAEPLFFVGPPGKANLFLSTHPPVGERLRRIRAL